MPAMVMLHEEDPRAVLQNKIGSLDDVELFHTQVLVAIYERPEQTKGGVILTQQYRAEDLSQGKVGLIVKTGPQAFQSDPNGQWSWPHGVGLGDWVFYRASDGWATSINKVPCRILEDTRIRGRISHPDQVW